MAPLSRLSRPKWRARWRATVLFPAPAGPSMATMILLAGVTGCEGVFFRTHPRFFVSCLRPGGKAKSIAVARLCARRQSRLAAARARTAHRSLSLRSYAPLRAASRACRRSWRRWRGRCAGPTWEQRGFPSRAGDAARRTRGAIRRPRILLDCSSRRFEPLPERALCHQWK